MTHNNKPTGKVREALEFYSGGIGYSEFEDGGKMARDALAELDKPIDVEALAADLSSKCDEPDADLTWIVEYFTSRYHLIEKDK